MHHPWRAFRALTDWTLQWAILPDGAVGMTCWDTRTVTLDPRQLQAQRRSTIAHETRHIERGPVPDNPVLAAREELWVEREAARLMIEIHALGEALAWSSSLSEAAAELWVDEALLRTRIDHLHPSERHYLIRRLEHHDD